jgi:hypothetical protein
VLDLIHVSEYVWKASLGFFGEKQAGREDWVEKRLSRILCGKASQVAAGIRRSATLDALFQKSRTRVKTGRAPASKGCGHAAAAVSGSTPWPGIEAGEWLCDAASPHAR